MEERTALVTKAMEGFVTDNPKEAEASLFVSAGMVLSAQAHGVPLDDVLTERVASAVHDAWLARNHAHASETERLSYGELPEEEKEKDRRFVRAILRIIDN